MPLYNLPTIERSNFRNRLINGDMKVDMRNGAAAQTITAVAALAYTVDRFYAYSTGANVTGQQIAGTNAAQFRYQFTGAASTTKIGFAQRIETINCYDLVSKNCTLSVDLSNSLLTTVTWTVSRATTTADTFGTLASPTVTQIATGTWTVSSTLANYTAAVALDASSNKGIQIELSVAAQTSGTWVIGNMQFEEGTAATPFEVVPTEIQKVRCFRYLPAFRSSSTNNTLPTNMMGASTTLTTGVIRFPATARTHPTGLVVSAASHISISRPSVGNTALTNIVHAIAGVEAGQIETTVASGMVVDIPYFIYFNSASGYIYWTGCEL